MVEENEGITEDFCFCCKDGGDLLLCDYKGCLKAYHPKCVGKDDSVLESEVSWDCNWHSCHLCHKSSKYHCFLCPRAYCGHCIDDVELALVRGNKGFCRKCSWLTKLIEDNVDVDSDGGKVNFDDRSSMEWLFKEYWLMRKEKENLTSVDVNSAEYKLRKAKKHRRDPNFELEKDEEVDEEIEHSISDEDYAYDLEEAKCSGKRKISKKKHASKKKAKEKKMEFIGWASKPLIEFLSAIGKDATQQLSQHEVISVITRYCEEHKLFHPEKRKKIICDATLQSLFGRKVLMKNKIYDRLETHITENVVQSDEGEIKFSSEDDENVLLASKKQRKSIPCKGSPQKEVVSAVQQSSLASIVPTNINLVYLRRSLVEKLLEQPETFDGKVTGSFVKVKSDPHDIWQKNPYMLVKVKGVKKTSSMCDIKSSFLLQVSNMLSGLPICKLLDDDISEEECKDLRQKMVQGLLARPTVGELQEKVKSLHEDITKHGIARELALLRNRIDRANEQGKRRELVDKLYEYLDKKKLLETPSEQARLLEEVPEVVAELAELGPDFEDSLRKDMPENNNVSAEVSIRKTPKTPVYRFKENWTSNYCVNGGAIATGDKNVANGDHASGNVDTGFEHKDGEANKEATAGSKQLPSGTCISEILPSHHQVVAPEIQNGHATPRDTSKTYLPQNLTQKATSATDTAGYKRNHQAAVQKQSAEAVVIELSDDDDGDVRASMEKQKRDDSKWQCVGPSGARIGPLPLSVLKRWREAGNSDVKWKAWKTCQSEDEAINLDDVFLQAFIGK